MKYPRNENRVITELFMREGKTTADKEETR